MVKVELPSHLQTIKWAAFSGCHPDLCLDLPETLIKVEHEALQGCRIRLPPKMSILKNAKNKNKNKNMHFLLHKVKEVIMSSSMNLGLLAGYLAGLPERYLDGLFLDFDLKFKVLYSGSSFGSSPRPLSEHMHESFVTFDITADDLISLHRARGESSLLRRTEFAFIHKASIFADVLGPTSLPVEALHFILPFLYGDKLTEEMMDEIVDAAGNWLAVSCPGRAVADHFSLRRKRKVDRQGGSRKRKIGTSSTYWY